MAGSISGVLINPRGQDHDFILFQGSTVAFGIVWGGSVPIDVTGYDAELTVRDGVGGTLITQFTTGNGRVSIGSTDGAINFSMTSTDSGALVAGDYIYELRVTDDLSNENQVMSGRFTIKAEL